MTPSKLKPTDGRLREMRLQGTSPADRILACSLQLFAERGFRSTSVRDIADACDLTSGALYNHFGSKDDVLYALIDRAHDRLDEMLEEALQGVGADPVERLSALIRGFVDYHAGWREESRVAEREYILLAPRARRRIVGRRRGVLELFEATVQDGVAAGVFVLPGEGGALTTRLVVMQVITPGVAIADWFDPAGPLSVGQLAELQVALALRTLGAA